MCKNNRFSFYLFVFPFFRRKYCKCWKFPVYVNKQQQQHLVCIDIFFNYILINLKSVEISVNDTLYLSNKNISQQKPKNSKYEVI